MNNPLARIRVGGMIGLVFGCFYAAWIILLLVTNGHEFFQRMSVNPALLMAAYLLSGVLGGAAVGLLQPLTRTWVGVAIVGFVVALPIVHLIGLTDGAADPFSAEELQVTAITAGLLGTVGGIILRAVFRGQRL